MDINLDTLKQQLQERAGLTPDQAEQAAKVALEFFSEQIPQAANLVERAGGVEEISKRLGGLFSR